MLPTDMELQEPKSKEWTLIPADVYQVEITNIEYKEIDNTRWKQKPEDPDKKQVMEFEFTIVEEGQHYGRKLWKQMAPIKPYPPSGGKETWVYRLASAMEGHSITKDEADKFTTSQINGYIHRQVRITVSQSAPKDNGKQYNNIDSFLTVKSVLPIFDANKVPKENQSEAAKTEPSGKDHAREVANNLPGAKPAATSQPDGNNEDVAPDIAEEAEKMANEVNVADIPF